MKLQAIASYNDMSDTYCIEWEDLITACTPRQLANIVFYWQCPKCGYYNKAEAITKIGPHFCNDCLYTIYNYDIIEFK